MIPTPAWMADAACLHHDPDLFFPHKSDDRTAQRASRICREDCHVQLSCLAHVLATERVDADRWGIWAGTTPRQRARIARKAGV